MSTSGKGWTFLPLQTARIEALQKAQQALGELRRLGANYDLVEHAAPPEAPTPEPAAQQAEQGADDAVKAPFDQSLYGS